MPIAECDAIFN